MIIYLANLPTECREGTYSSGLREAFKKYRFGMFVKVCACVRTGVHTCTYRESCMWAFSSVELVSCRPRAPSGMLEDCRALNMVLVRWGGKIWWRYLLCNNPRVALSSHILSSGFRKNLFGILFPGKYCNKYKIATRIQTKDTSAVMLVTIPMSVQSDKALPFLIYLQTSYFYYTMYFDIWAFIT